MKQNAKMANASESVAKAQQSKNGVVGSKKSNYRNTFKKGVDYLFVQKLVREGEHKVTKIYNMTPGQIARRDVELYTDSVIANEITEYKDSTGKYIREVFTIGDNNHIISRHLLSDILWDSMCMYQKDLNRKHKTNHRKVEALMVRIFELYLLISMDSDEELDRYLKASKLRFVIKYRKMPEIDKNSLKSLGKIYENENGGSDIKLNYLYVNAFFLANLFRYTGFEWIKKGFTEKGIFHLFYANYIEELDDSLAAKATMKYLNFRFDISPVLTEELVIKTVSQSYRLWYY